MPHNAQSVTFNPATSNPGSNIIIYDSNRSTNRLLTSYSFLRKGSGAVDRLQILKRDRAINQEFEQSRGAARVQKLMPASPRIFIDTSPFIACAPTKCWPS